VSKCGLIYCPDELTICGGAIGAGSVTIIQRFCSKSPRECNIVKHLSSKVILRPDYLYIKCKKSQAWHEPSIDAKRLPVTCDVETLVMSEKPHDVWAAYFSSVKACGFQPSAITGLDSSETESWEEVEAPDVENFERAKNNLQTPKRLRLGPLLVAAVEAASPTPQAFIELQGLNPSLSAVAGSEDIHERTWLQTVFADWNPMVANFKIVAQELRQNNSGSTEYKFAVNETISKLQGALRETDTKIQLVVAMIGTAPQHTDINSSVWESMGQLRSKLGNVKEQVEDGFKEMADLHKTEKATSDKLMDLTVSFDNLANSYSENFRAIKDKLITLEQGRRETSSNGYPGTGRRGIRWNNLSLDASPEAGTSIEDKVSGLRRRLVDLKHGSLQSHSSQNDKAIDSLRLDLNETTNKLREFESVGLTQTDGTVVRQIEVLQQRLKDVEAQGG
jgi:hypothetical protein